MTTLAAGAGAGAAAVAAVPGFVVSANQEGELACFVDAAQRNSFFGVTIKLLLHDHVHPGDTTTLVPIPTENKQTSCVRMPPSAAGQRVSFVVNNKRLHPVDVVVRTNEKDSGTAETRLPVVHPDHTIWTFTVRVAAAYEGAYLHPLAANLHRKATDAERAAACWQREWTEKTAAAEEARRCATRAATCQLVDDSSSSSSSSSVGVRAGADSWIGFGEDGDDSDDSDDFAPAQTKARVAAAVAKAVAAGDKDGGGGTFACSVVTGQHTFDRQPRITLVDLFQFHIIFITSTDTSYIKMF
jgi:hypothetical protein